MSTFEAFLNHPIETLERALQIRKQIDQLNEVLKELFGPTSISLGAMQTGLTDEPIKKRRGRPRKVEAVPSGWETGNGFVADGGKKKRKMSAAAKAKIAAAQRARWAKVKSEKPQSAEAEPKAKRKKRKLSPEARAKIVAAVKARWEREKGKA